MSLILVVDDDEQVAKTIEITLAQSGHHAILAHNGYEALHWIRRQRPDLILLDIAMPEMDGIEVCRRIRASPTTTAIPILFLTASGGIESKIAGFNAGADDYLVKPFNLQELELRVQALLRRAQAHSRKGQANLVVGALTLNCQTFEVTVGERTALLTPVEFELLCFLMSNAGRVFSGEQLLREVWGFPPRTGSPDLVRVHVKNLRGKIEANPHEPVLIKTVGRFGYTIPLPE